MTSWMFEQLMFWASQEKMTPDDVRQQRISFAYGNVAMHNPDITRELVERIDKELHPDDY